MVDQYGGSLNFNTSNFRNSIEYTKTVTIDVEEKLRKCLTLTGQLSQTVSSNPQLSAIWDSFNQSFASIMEKYRERTNELVRLVSQYEEVTVANDKQLTQIIESIGNSLTGIISRINNL